MKSIAFTLGAFATLVVAQDPSSLPQCGQRCAADMLTGPKAAELNCSEGDLSCLCQNPNFIYGFRDCSGDNCGPDEARQIVEYGVQLCAAEGVEITDAPGGGASATSTGGDGTDGGAGGAGGSVSTIFSTVTSDDEAITTAIATTTLSGGSEASSSGEDQSGSETDATDSATGGIALVSTYTSDGSVLLTTLTTVTPTTSASESGATESTGSDATTASSTSGSGSETEASSTEGSESTASDGASETGDEATGTETTDAGDAAMPQRTIAPGLVAAAGLAALLL